jgi:hypothetical protein
MLRRVLYICMISILLTGCTLSTNEQSESSYEGVEIERIGSQVIEKYPASMMDQKKFDFKQSGTDQSIEMYADVEKVTRDGQEEYVWDDGQRWLLMVNDGEKTYPLFDDWVQLGELTFWLIEADGTPMLQLLSTGTADFHLQSYVYDKNADEFVRKSIYSPTGNVIFRGSSTY